MKSKLFLIVLLLAAITTIGISQDRQSQAAKKKAAMAERARIYKLPAEAQSLAGVKGIYVLFQGLDEDHKPTDSGKEQLKKDIKLKLRRAGIKVYSEEEWLASQDGERLMVTTVTKNSDSSLNRMYYIALVLVQDVVLHRSPNATVPGNTWNRFHMELGPKSKFLEIARLTTNDHMDKFIKDYRIANPIYLF